MFEMLTKIFEIDKNVRDVGHNVLDFYQNDRNFDQHFWDFDQNLRFWQKIEILTNILMIFTIIFERDFKQNA